MTPCNLTSSLPVHSRMGRPEIYSELHDAAPARFANARVRTVISLLVCRYVRDELRARIDASPITPPLDLQTELLPG